MKSAIRFLVAVMATLPMLAHAAEENAMPGRWFVQMFSIHPGHEATFEQLVNRYQEAAAELDQPAWFASSPAVGEDMSTYTFAMAAPSFTMLEDDTDAVVEAFGQEAGMEVMAMAQESIASVRTMMVRHAPELSVAPENGPNQATLVYEIRLKPNMEEEWSAFMAKLVEASTAVAPDARWNAFWGGLGAPANMFGIRIPMDWADMDSPAMPLEQRMVQHFGKRNGERLWEQGGELVDTVRTSVVRARWDLSHMPGQSVASSED